MRSAYYFITWALIVKYLLLDSSVVLAKGELSPAEAQFEGVSIDQRLGNPVPLDARFRDETGRLVALGQFFDGRRPVILTLVYYKCPMLCTLVLNDTLRAIRAMSGLSLGPDYRIVTVSFDPREGPDLAALKKQHYISEFCRGLRVNRTSADSNWHFLTGNESTIRELTQSVGFHYRWDAKYGQYAHASGIIVLTPHGKIARYFFGIGYEPNDLRLSLAEASDNKIGGLTEKFLLFCFHYDPNRGKYSLAILNAVQIGGVTIIVALGILIWALSRSNRQRQMKFAVSSTNCKLE
jgi:protein SCO1